MGSITTTDQLKAAPKIAHVSPWSSAPKNLILRSDEVHVWRATLDLQYSRVQSLQQTLAADERRRAERFYFQTDREHFIVARGLLRAILGRYLDADPSRLRFSYSPYGKPSLAGEINAGALCFNISHAGGLALYAVTRGRDIGIDLERIDTDFATEQVAERFFSAQEVATLRAFPEHMQSLAFFNCWTRKEAYIKARGEGLSLPLDQFDVSLTPGEPVALLRTNGDPQEASRWRIQELAPGASCVSALAVKGHHWRLKCWQWSKESHEDDDTEAASGADDLLL